MIYCWSLCLFLVCSAFESCLTQAWPLHRFRALDPDFRGGSLLREAVDRIRNVTSSGIAVRIGDVTYPVITMVDVSDSTIVCQPGYLKQDHGCSEYFSRNLSLTTAAENIEYSSLWLTIAIQIWSSSILWVSLLFHSYGLADMGNVTLSSRINPILSKKTWCLLWFTSPSLFIRTG